MTDYSCLGSGSDIGWILLRETREDPTNITLDAGGANDAIGPPPSVAAPIEKLGKRVLLISSDHDSERIPSPVSRQQRKSDRSIPSYSFQRWSLRKSKHKSTGRVPSPNEGPVKIIVNLHRIRKMALLKQSPDKRLSCGGLLSTVESQIPYDHREAAEGLIRISSATSHT